MVVCMQIQNTHTLQVFRFFWLHHFYAKKHKERLSCATKTTSLEPFVCCWLWICSKITATDKRADCCGFRFVHFCCSECTMQQWFWLFQAIGIQSKQASQPAPAIRECCVHFPPQKTCPFFHAALIDYLVSFIHSFFLLRIIKMAKNLFPINAYAS